jgi:predicted anti-sigma-YlaC factor YlaD
VRPVQGQCERARHWASAELDGELSSFEHALLADHVARCADCREFRDSVTGLTTALRAAPCEPFAGVSLAGIRRRRIRLPLAPAAVAMAVAAIGLGSILASVQLKGATVGNSPPLLRTPAVAGPDTLNLSTLAARERVHTNELTGPQRAVHGGHVVLEP